MPLQLFTLVVATIGIAALLRPPDILRWLYPLAATSLLALNLCLYGLYWPMFPAYLVLAVCSFVLPRPQRRSASFLLAVLSMLLVVASAALVYALPLFLLPGPTGPYAIGTRTEHLTDPATHRELTVQLWYPAAAAHGPRARYMRLRETKPHFVYWHWVRTNSFADAPLASGSPYPLLLFGHMWGGRRTQDTFLAEDLASHGYVVAAADHPGNSARTELADGSVIVSDRAGALSNLDATTAPNVRALWTNELAVWTADNRFVLASLFNAPPSWLAGRLDATRVGAFGHSFGGAASLALLGGEPPAQDPRVQAALNMDGWTFDALDRRTTQPVLLLYAAPANGPLVPPSASASIDDQLERQDLAAVGSSLARYGGCATYIRATQHADFTDETLVSPLRRLTFTGPMPGERIRTLTRALVLSFFDRTLNHSAVPAPTYPEAESRCLPGQR